MWTTTEALKSLLGIKNNQAQLYYVLCGSWSCSQGSEASDTDPDAPEDRSQERARAGVGAAWTRVALAIRLGSGHLMTSAAPTAAGDFKTLAEARYGGSQWGETPSSSGLIPTSTSTPRCWPTRVGWDQRGEDRTCFPMQSTRRRALSLCWELWVVAAALDPAEGMAVPGLAEGQSRAKNQGWVLGWNHKSALSPETDEARPNERP